MEGNGKGGFYNKSLFKMLKIYIRNYVYTYMSKIRFIYKIIP